MMPQIPQPTLAHRSSNHQINKTTMGFSTKKKKKKKKEEENYGV